MRQITECPACEGARIVIRVDDCPQARERYLAFSAITYGGVIDNWLSEIALRIRQCRDCGHCWYEQQPNEAQLSTMYEAIIPRSPGPPPRSPTAGMVHQMRRLRTLVSRIRPGRNPADLPALLDYGSGYGRWARAAAEVGFRVVAFEPSVSRGRDPEATAAGIEVIHDLSVLEGCSFDAVNLEQVLEHIPDPGAALTGLLSHCRAETVLRITVPNILRSYEGGRLWADWPYDGARAHTLAPFQHLHGFTPNSLRRIAARSGFSPVAMYRVLPIDPVHAVRIGLRWLLPSYDQTLLFATMSCG